MQNQKPVIASCWRVFFGLLLALVFVALPNDASAQSVIKRPGAHPKYSVELEPHGVLGWGGWYPGPFDDDGFGIGVRATIPIVEQGPIKTINNSMGIGFGGDFLFFGDDDRCYWGRCRGFGYDYGGNALYLPVVLQWNFWLTDVISVFGEPGLAIRHAWIHWEEPCGSPSGLCEETDSDTDFVPFIFWGGGRFMFGKSVGLTVRIGWPYLSVGASFLL